MASRQNVLLLLDKADLAAAQRIADQQQVARAVILRRAVRVGLEAALCTSTEPVTATIGHQPDHMATWLAEQIAAINSTKE